MIPTPEERTKSERFQSYRRGWQHGAGHRPRDKRFEEHPTREDIRQWYGRGYQHGFDAMCLAGVYAAELLQYDPYVSILRKAPPADPPTEPSSGAVNDGSRTTEKKT